MLPTDLARFVWPTLYAHLPACGVLIGPSAVEIRPYHPLTQTLPGCRRAKKRMYLSATLGTMDDLQRRLGVGPVVNVVEDPIIAGDAGNRLLLLNPSEFDEPLSDRVITFVLTQAARCGRVAWLCASHAEADEVETLLASRSRTSYRLRGGGDDAAIERWSFDPNGHLVTAGRYDGLDFAGDLCRLVVLPSVPVASTEFERFVMAYLGDATYMRHRVGQRVTQALGRANRRAEDWAMYIGLSPAFGPLLAQSAVQVAVPTDVKPTLAATLARLDGGWPAAEEAARAFWDSHGASAAAAEPPAGTGGRNRPGRARAAATAGSAVDEVQAVNQLWLGDHTSAAEAAGRAALALANAGEIEHAAFWRYVIAQAEYASGTPGAEGRAIDALRIATEGGAVTGWFVRLKRVLADLRGTQAAASSEMPWGAWDEWLRTSSPLRIERALARAETQFAGTHDEQAEGLEKLGRVLGVQASRLSGGSAADAVWNWSAGRHVERRLWEVKTGDAERVPRDWVNQSVGQIAAERAAGSSVTIVGCLLTHLTEMEPDASIAARDLLCVIHVEAVQALLVWMADRLRGYAQRWGSGSAQERGAARDAIEPRILRGAWLAELLVPSQGRVVNRTEAEQRLAGASA